MLKNFRRIGTYIFFGVIIAIEVAFTLFVLLPQVKVLLAKREQLEITKKEYAEVSKTMELILKLDKDQVESNLKVATAALPDGKKTSGIVKGITQLAGENGLAVKTLEFAPGLLSTASADTQIPASLVLVGKLDSLIDFLSVLEKSSQIIGVDSVGFSISRTSGESAGLSLAIYYQPLKSDKITWRDIQALTIEEQKIVDELPPEDSFILPSEQR